VDKNDKEISGSHAGASIDGWCQLTWGTEGERKSQMEYRPGFVGWLTLVLKVLIFEL